MNRDTAAIYRNSKRNPDIWFRTISIEFTTMECWREGTRSNGYRRESSILRIKTNPPPLFTKQHSLHKPRIHIPRQEMRIIHDLQMQWDRRPRRRNMKLAQGPLHSRNRQRSCWPMDDELA